MITNERKRAIKSSLQKQAKYIRLASKARQELIGELQQAKGEGATYSELGDMLGVTRQRVHQILGGRSVEEHQT